MDAVCKGGPYFDNLRSDQRFQDLLRRMDFPPWLPQGSDEQLRFRELFLLPRVPLIESGSPNKTRPQRRVPKREKEHTMGGELIGLVAVILGMGVPLGALYTYYRVRRLRSEERLAAIARGVDIPLEPELNQAAHSRRAGILLVSGALGYIATFGLIAGIQADRDIWTVAAFGIIPLAVGIGYFVDWSMIRRDSHA